MLTEVSDAIVAQLQTIQEVSHVGEWAGQVEDLVKTTQPTPSLHVVYAGAQFNDKPVAIGTKIAEHRMVWTVVLISKNLRSHGEGALEAYVHIEAVRAKLIKFAVPGGWLWPVREGLIVARNGILSYGLDYAITART